MCTHTVDPRFLYTVSGHDRYAGMGGTQNAGILLIYSLSRQRSRQWLPNAWHVCPLTSEHACHDQFAAQRNQSYYLHGQAHDELQNETSPSHLQYSHFSTLFVLIFLRTILGYSNSNYF